MSEASLVLWDDTMLGYDLGPEHPMRPVRLELTIALARELGVLDRPGVEVAEPGPASDADLELVHDPTYLQVVKQAPDRPGGRINAMFGLGTPDNPIFARMHQATALITGASLAAARAVHTGSHLRAASIAGGLHHAMRAHASGFCVYNDAAVAIRWLVEQGRRVAYLDLDVHHGDGVQAAFWHDPRVLTLSLHESGHYLFPGTGFAGETGGPGAEGTAVNVALPPGTGDAGWLRAFSGVVPVLLQRFAPDVVVSQHGCDSHALDPIADLALTVDAQAEAARLVRGLADRLCGGRWIALGGGGYDHTRVVPRAWTHLLATVTGDPLPPDTLTPTGWRDLAERRHAGPGPVPPDLTDGGTGAFCPWDAGTGDPDDPVDAAVAATRDAVLPLHGLDPLVDR